MTERVEASERLERLPISNYHKMICSVLFISWFSEAIDLGGISYLMPVLTKTFNLTAVQGGYLSSICFGGMFIGSLVAGTLSDLMGRKKMIIIAMALWGTAGVLLSQQTTIMGLYVTRFFLGLGLGSQIPVAMTYLSEIIPSGSRGKFLTLYQMLIPAGIASAGLLTVFILPAYGWQGCFIAESFPALSLFLVWKILPESALWLESKGKLEEADLIVAMWEHKIQKETKRPLPPVISRPKEKVKKPGKVTELFSRKYWKILFMCLIWYTCAMMSDYGLATWLSALLMDKGFSMIKSTHYISLSVLGGLPAFFLVAWGVEKWGRKLTVLTGAGLTAVFAFLYGISSSVLMVIAMGTLYQFGKYALAMANNVYTPELFDTHLRATGVGFALACGRLGSIIGPIFLAWVMTTFGVTATFLSAAGSAVFAGLVVMALGPETKGKVFNS